MQRAQKANDILVKLISRCAQTAAETRPHAIVDLMSLLQPSRWQEPSRLMIPINASNALMQALVEEHWQRLDVVIDTLVADRNIRMGENPENKTVKKEHLALSSGRGYYELLAALRRVSKANVERRIRSKTSYLTLEQLIGEELVGSHWLLKHIEGIATMTAAPATICGATRTELPRNDLGKAFTQEIKSLDIWRHNVPDRFATLINIAIHAADATKTLNLLMGSLVGDRKAVHCLHPSQGFNARRYSVHLINMLVAMAEKLIYNLPDVSAVAHTRARKKSTSVDKWAPVYELEAEAEKVEHDLLALVPNGPAFFSALRPTLGELVSFIFFSHHSPYRRDSQRSKLPPKHEVLSAIIVLIHGFQLAHTSKDLLKSIVNAAESNLSIDDVATVLGAIGTCGERLIASGTQQDALSKTTMGNVVAKLANTFSQAVTQNCNRKHKTHEDLLKKKQRMLRWMTFASAAMAVTSSRVGVVESETKERLRRELSESLVFQLQWALSLSTKFNVEERKEDSSSGGGEAKASMPAALTQEDLNVLTAVATSPALPNLQTNPELGTAFTKALIQTFSSAPKPYISTLAQNLEKLGASVDATVVCDWLVDEAMSLQLPQLTPSRLSFLLSTVGQHVNPHTFTPSAKFLEKLPALIELFLKEDSDCSIRDLVYIYIHCRPLLGVRSLVGTRVLEADGVSVPVVADVDRQLTDNREALTSLVPILQRLQAVEDWNAVPVRAQFALTTCLTKDRLWHQCVSVEDGKENEKWDALASTAPRGVPTENMLRQHAFIAKAERTEIAKKKRKEEAAEEEARMSSADLASWGATSIASGDAVEADFLL